jgi:hypothetical protein
VYTALLQPHDRIMGLDLPSGGHLTHGFYNGEAPSPSRTLITRALSLTHSLTHTHTRMYGVGAMHRTQMRCVRAPLSARRTHLATPEGCARVPRTCMRRDAVWNSERRPRAPLAWRSQP